MVYKKTLWKDQNVERPKTYEMTQNEDGSYALIDSFGEVIELGTPVNAANMNNIENGIDGLYDSGIPSYDSTRTYSNQSIVKSFDENNNLVLYVSTASSNVGNDLSDEDYWKKTELRQKNSFLIGDPILTLSSTLGENEIWLNGAAVSRTTYSNLFSIYGTTYGSGDGSTTFNLPSFSNRALWGSTSFGTISAGLPSHKHYMFSNDSNATSVDNRQNMLTATQQVASWWYSGYGAYVLARSNVSATLGLSGNPTQNSIYGKSTTVQPPAIKVRVKTRYQ